MITIRCGTTKITTDLGKIFTLSFYNKQKIFDETIETFKKNFDDEYRYEILRDIKSIKPNITKIAIRIVSIIEDIIQDIIDNEIAINKLSKDYIIITVGDISKIYDYYNGIDEIGRLFFEDNFYNFMNIIKEKLELSDDDDNMLRNYLIDYKSLILF